jgi:2OG-Fe(II) oxygenase superfamily
MTPTPYDGLAGQILSGGYAHAHLTRDQQVVLSTAYDAAAEFFTRPLAERQAHRGQPGIPGYWPYAARYATNPARPDQSETFALQGRSRAGIPAISWVLELCDGLSGWRDIASGITGAILGQFDDLYEHPRLGHTEGSHAEVSWFGQPPPEQCAMLHDRHEDQHLLTLVAATQPGLEIELGGRMEPVTFSGAEVLIMPGSVLTAMTNGRVRPLWHQVRNYGIAGRMSLVYMVHPSGDTVTPYVHGKISNGMDIATVARQGCSARVGRIPADLTAR